MRYENALRIDAPVAVVWDLTVDVERWPELTPTMQRVEPLDPLPLDVGGRARIKQPMQPAAVWTVTAVEPQRRFTWTTRRPGLVMVADHLLEEDGDGCLNTLSLEVTGAGAGLFGALFGAAARRAIGLENDGFKREAER